MLIHVTDYEQVAAEVNALLLRSGATNGLPDRERLEAEIAKGELFLQRENYGLLLLKRKPQWDLLRFILIKGESLRTWIPTRSTVVELPFRREGDPMYEVAQTLEAMGFRRIFSRIRYTRKANPDASYLCDGIEEGREDDGYALMEKSFSPLTGCIPTREEWENRRAQGQILTLPGGVLHYERKGKSSELRHLAVAEECRNQGYGKALVGAYLNRCGMGLSRVWTGEDNAVAQRLYESFGYERDSMTSQVYYFDKDEEL